MARYNSSLVMVQFFRVLSTDVKKKAWVSYCLVLGPAYGGYPARPASYPAMPYPPAGAAGQGMPPYPAAQPSHGTPYPPAAGGGGGAQQPPYPPMGAVPYGGGGGGYPPPYATVQTQQQSSNGPGDSGTITQEMLKMSLMSAVEDKIKKELADDFNTKQG